MVLSANLWIALRWPTFTAPLGVGIAGTFFALFASSAKAAKFYPWLLPLNALSEDRLPAALALGIGGGLLVAALGSLDFVGREESASPKLGRPAVVMLTSMLVAFLSLAAYLDRAVLAQERRERCPACFDSVHSTLHRSGKRGALGGARLGRDGQACCFARRSGRHRSRIRSVRGKAHRRIPRLRHHSPRFWSFQ